MQTPSLLVLIGLSAHTKLYPGNSKLSSSQMKHLSISKFLRGIYKFVNRDVSAKKTNLWRCV